LSGDILVISDDLDSDARSSSGTPTPRTSPASRRSARRKGDRLSGTTRSPSRGSIRPEGAASSPSSSVSRSPRRSSPDMISRGIGGNSSGASLRSEAARFPETPPISPTISARRRSRYSTARASSPPIRTRSGPAAASPWIISRCG
jgi:hypothetical protein